MKHHNIMVVTLVIATASSINSITLAQNHGNITRRIVRVPGYVERFRQGSTLVTAGRAAEQAGNLAEAESDYRKAHQVAPEDGENLLDLAHILQKQHKDKEALKTWRDLVYPKQAGGSVNGDTRVQMEYILFLLDGADMNGANWREAVNLYDAARSQIGPSESLPDVFNPDRRDYTQMRARAHLILSHNYRHAQVSREEKLRHLETAVRELPPTPRNLLKLGIALDEAGRFEEAQSAFHRAQALAFAIPIDKDTKSLLSYYLYAEDYKVQHKNRLAKQAQQEKLAKAAAH